MPRFELTSRASYTCCHNCARRQVGCRTECPEYQAAHEREMARKAVEARNKLNAYNSFTTHRIRGKGEI